MKDKEKNLTPQDDLQEELLDDENLDQYSGGTMRNNIITTPTTDISDNTKNNI